jgi:hypothetical protein
MEGVMRAKFMAEASCAALLALSMSAVSVQGVSTALHIDSVNLTKTECCKPLEFKTVIKNVGAYRFNREAAVIIKAAGNQIGHQFVMNIPALGSITDVQSSPDASFVADCCKGSCFEVSLAATLKGGVVEGWDKAVYKICTKPGNVIVVSR